MNETVAVPRDLLARVIRSLDRNVLERPCTDKFLPSAPHTCDEDCADAFAHDGMWVSSFGPHPLAEQLRALLEPPPSSAPVCVRDRKQAGCQTPAQKETT